jgi:hypothetical protein
MIDKPNLLQELPCRPIGQSQEEPLPYLGNCYRLIGEIGCLADVLKRNAQMTTVPPVDLSSVEQEVKLTFNADGLFVASNVRSRDFDLV